jgi:pimeloyl-ACP methyl ester carboxylesterase
MERTFEVQTPDGRTLHVHEAGAADGRVVIGHHGTPSSGRHYAPHVEAAEARGLRLLDHDRPGYGGSSPRPGRTVAAVVEDVVTILDALGVERFVTWGGSGGGPHALACAALLPERCAAAASVSGVAPFDAEGLDWLAGMGEDNVAEFAAARESRDAVTAFCGEHAAQLLDATPSQLVDAMRSLLSDVDAAVVTERFGEHLVAGARHALGDGVEGWVEDDEAFLAPWGFDVGAITVPTLVWQGRHDLMVPPAHGEWLAAHVAGTEARLSEDDGHLTLVERRIPDVYDWLAQRAR